MRTLWYAGLLLLTGIVLLSCQSGDLRVGQSVISPQELVVQSVDTLTLKTSTVMRPDSFVTSGDNNILVGQWTDSQTGKMTARSFAAINYASNTFLGSTSQQLDSLVLELSYAFVYGDTTSAFNISVHTLNKPLIYQAYYNTNSVAYSSKPYLQKTVLPQPLTLTKKISFRMPADVEKEFYNKLVNGDIIDATTLAEYIPGFAFNCNSTTNTFAGFVAASSGLRLYYHATTVDLTQSSLLFPMSLGYFTQLTNDLSGTPLSALKNRTDAVSSRLTNNTTFIVPGAHIQTRLELPYLDQFARPDGFADLNKALLVISPVRNSLKDNSPPPTNLALFFTNTQNDILPSALPGGPGGTTSAIAQYSLQATAQNQLGPDPGGLPIVDAYTFDLTYYIGQIIKRKLPNQPLLLTLPTSTQTQTSLTLKDYIQRVTIGDQQRANDQMKVQLFLTSGT
ncbi:DUF4270 family protein [Spirosoma sp. HMF3257]|uniref:DUF4270 domain-containing protein n=1 Tax=Spirosoma telluris TaxID=2183553 RepID=A0A327NGU6_9BACT|nr:DUF4270 family protein [Spirosoma telluris]RAI74023.1 hypothetical protein HMF3257_05955 [Spirosoma telluris]